MPPEPGSEAEDERRSEPGPRPSPSCPTCGSEQCELASLFGTQAMTLQYRCRDCGDYFEAIKYADP